MSDYNPGIAALAGFSFQIKVFITQLAKLEKDGSVNYEVGDDVSITENDEWSGKLKNSSFDTLVQVKQTKVSDESSKKVLFNWLLAEPADKYRLIVCKNCSVNENYITTESPQNIYDALKMTDSPLSLESRVYKYFKEKKLFTDFENKIKHIRDNYKLENDFDVDESINECFEKVFHKTDKTANIYEKRLKEFIQTIYYRIMHEVSHKKTYSMSYDDLYRLIDEICLSISDESYEIDYEIFESANKIEITDSIKQKREYKQLFACDLPESRIISDLIKELYYRDYKDHYLEIGKETKISNIESEAIDNYELEKLNDENNTPKKLYIHTISKEIQQLGKLRSTGTYISLTSDNDKKITWKENI